MTRIDMMLRKVGHVRRAREAQTDAHILLVFLFIFPIIFTNVHIIWIGGLKVDLQQFEHTLSVLERIVVLEIIIFYYASYYVIYYIWLEFI